jgi:hypothetical protein
MRGEIALHRGFLDALSRLSKQDQARVRSSVDMLFTSQSVKGLRSHKVGVFVSLSASLDLRIISWMDGARHVLVHVDHHDAAYRWAETHAPLLGDGSELLALVDEPIAAASLGPSPVGDRFFRLPTPVARALEALQGDDERLDFLRLLPPELQEQGLAALVGDHTDASVSPPSDVVVLENDAALRAALTLPNEAWRVFLHPRQRYVVDIPVDRHLLLRGGPGTGKTVALVHRFARLTRELPPGARPPLLIALAAASRDVLRRDLSRLGARGAGENVVSTHELPKGEAALERALSRWSSILVDEAQDLPTAYVATILGLLDRSRPLPQHVLAFDANQAIVSPTGDALQRLEKYCDIVTLTYSYRSTVQIVHCAQRLLRHLHENYTGRTFQHRHEIAASRDQLTGVYRSALSGPEVSVTLVAQSEGMDDAAELAVSGLRGRYDLKDIAVVVVTDATGEGGELVDRIARRLSGCEVLRPPDAKGREFLAGVIVDGSTTGDNGSAGDVVTRARYRTLCGLYVGLTRFRDRAACLVRSRASPLMQSRSE